MKVLAPIDGSECSERSLRFATEFARRYEADLHVVHITDHRTESTEALLERASKILAEEGFEDEPELVADTRMSEPRFANAVGKDIVRIATEDDFDHVVMGHHGEGAIGKLLLGSAAETVLGATEVPATIIP